MKIGYGSLSTRAIVANNATATSNASDSSTSCIDALQPLARVADQGCVERYHHTDGCPQVAASVRGLKSTSTICGRYETIGCYFDVKATPPAAWRSHATHVDVDFSPRICSQRRIRCNQHGRS